MLHTMNLRKRNQSGPQSSWQPSSPGFARKNRSSLNKLVIPASLLLVYVSIAPFILLSHEASRSANNVIKATTSAIAGGGASSSASKPEQGNAEKRRELTQTIQSSSFSSIIQSASSVANSLVYGGKRTKYFQDKIPKPDPNYPTGSFANCTADMITSTKASESKAVSNHPDASMVTISCREIHFRAPLSTIEKGGSPIVVGVLSGAGGKGPIHRDSIRATWARDRKGVYFIVAGPWEDIEKEYNDYRDLIWIDEDEVYEGEESVLPFKTETFLYIMNKYALEGKAGFEYLFKTDDDSYVDLTKLENELYGKVDINYWGCCTDEHYKPLRHVSMKWRISYELYPEEYYPRYCQGAGFAVSREMAQCITDEENIKNFRYNPFEDVSVGLLAERCGYRHTSNCELIQQHRSDDVTQRKQKKIQKIEEVYFIPIATMKGKILQHRVKTYLDMYNHHKCALEDC